MRVSWNRLSVCNKVIVITLGVLVLVGAVQAGVFNASHLRSARRMLAEKGAAFTELAQLTQEHIEGLVAEDETVADALLSDPDRVHMGWKAAGEAAHKVGLTFRITVPGARNAEHDPRQDKAHGAFRENPTSN